VSPLPTAFNPNGGFDAVTFGLTDALVGLGATGATTFLDFGAVTFGLTDALVGFGATGATTVLGLGATGLGVETLKGAPALGIEVCLCTPPKSVTLGCVALGALTLGTVVDPFQGSEIFTSFGGVFKFKSAGLTLVLVATCAEGSLIPEAEGDDLGVAVFFASILFVA
jgi:hypothetical protein